PSYYQQYPQVADIEGHFGMQRTRLLEHQTHVRSMWDTKYELHHPEQDQEAQAADFARSNIPDVPFLSIYFI
ncbi:hypothetical protein A2U01_0084546, partial [Trifolium medium]|nr:hypothetical protein [Trifolium medium]